MAQGSLRLFFAVVLTAIMISFPNQRALAFSSNHLLSLKQTPFRARNLIRMISSSEVPEETLYLETPLIKSLPTSKVMGLDVWLKLDCLQPSGSFKDRGMAHLITSLKKRGIKKVISSSGGNAGHAAARAARLRGLGCEVVVPATTKALMLDRVRAQGAAVQVHGENWNAADALAREKCAADPAAAAYVSPYDDPLLWEGHATVVAEIAAAGLRPDAIVASVGGGGLLCGIYQGLQKLGWNDVMVVATETQGADSFAASFNAGEMRRLQSIDSIATSLGALEVTEKALEYSKSQPTKSVVVADRAAVAACLALLRDHRLLVEPACGAALAAAAAGDPAAAAAGDPAPPPPLRPLLPETAKSVVIIVCGGGAVDLDIINDFKAKFDL